MKFERFRKKEEKDKGMKFQKKKNTLKFVKKKKYFKQN